MDKNGKSRHSVWLSDDVWREVDALYKLDNCPTRNEFVEKALRQYCGRLHAERTGAYLPRALQEVLEGTLGVFGDRLGRLLFKLVVEHNMTNHLLGGDIDMTRDEYGADNRGAKVPAPPVQRQAQRGGRIAGAVPAEQPCGIAGTDQATATDSQPW